MNVATWSHLSYRENGFEILVVGVPGDDWGYRWGGDRDGGGNLRGCQGEGIGRVSGGVCVKTLGTPRVDDIKMILCRGKSRC